MNFRLTLRVLGGLMMFLGGMLLTPIPFSLLHPQEATFHDGALWAFLGSSILTLVVGGAAYRLVRAQGDMTYREGFGVVTLGWIGYALFGSIPYLLIDEIPGIVTPVDAFFEAMSGFSTTGATVLTDPDSLPESILFWRSMTQWLGGMGMIVLSLAILPFLGVGGMQLFEAEVPGPIKDRLSPRIQDTAKLLWVVYVLITAAEVALLLLGGMSLFESTCHALTTMATGGFSTRGASLAAFNRYIQFVVIVFMFLAGVNFSLHYQALRRGKWRYWLSEEFRFYLAIAVFSSILIAGLLILDPTVPGSPLVKFEQATFQAVSLLTTTGYATADYEEWPAMAQYILVTLMFIGGSAGSTAGSMKVVRILLVLKHAVLQLSRLIHPHEVRVLRLDQQPVSSEVIQSILGFFALFVTVFVVASVIMAGIVPPASDGSPDLLTAATAVISALGNVGPGLGTIGPTETYTSLPMIAKLALALCMLVGRLEVFTVLVLFFPSFWRK